MRTVVLPDIHLLGGIAATVYPDDFLEVDLQRGVTLTGEQQVLLVQDIHNRVAGEVEFNHEGSVFVNDDPLVALADIGTGIGDAPPARGDAHIVPVGIDGGLQVEGAGLHLVPQILRDGVDFLAGRVTLGGEAVITVPVDGTVRAVILPDGGPHNLFVATATNPLFLLEVDGQRGVTLTGEQQVLLVQDIHNRVAGEVEFNHEGSVFVNDDPLVALADIGTGIGDAPPARGDAHIVPVGIDGGLQVERAGLHPLPHIGRDGGDFLAGLEAFAGKAVVAVPVDGTVRTIVFPDDFLHNLPVTAVGGRHVNKFRQGEFPSVNR